jgi:general L-amino acid transport system permease protein
MTTAYELVYVRREEEPVLAPPPGEVGVVGWFRRNLFSSLTNSILTLVGIGLIAWIVPPIIRWAFLDAVWTGTDRQACLAPGAGACWPFVEAKFGQFMYGRYPLDQRWRVEITAVLLVIGLIPLAIPRAPFKRETIFYLLALFPVAALILLTGGHFPVSASLVAELFIFGTVVTAVVAVVTQRRIAPILAGMILPVAILVVLVTLVGVYGALPSEIDLGLFIASTGVGGIVLPVATLVALAGGLWAIYRRRGSAGGRRVVRLWIAVGALLVLCLVLRTNFGLVPVETSLWGGLLVTLVVAIVGIVASLPIGIVLALGRRSRMPVVRLLSVTLIEFVRGVPLITVLFMASVMLPVFLPPGVTFDKLLRALIGVAIFSSAYMAEVVRGGLQAIGRGQYEGAQAIGLGYWQMMRLVVLPQALRIVIPGIVNSFISLFKDTSLVLIIGIFDLLGIVQLGFSDANWAGPNTPATGYAFAALVFWLFCFSMSRYSIYTERRLHTGHRRR